MSVPVANIKVVNQTTQVTGTGIMCEKISLIILLQESLRASSGMNNVGLIARALLLKNNPSLDEEESVKWQTLQVSAMSIGSFFGRVLIGIYPSRAQYFSQLSNFLSDRCDGRHCKA